MEKQENKKVKD